jgi:hypothetical protein
MLSLDFLRSLVSISAFVVVRAVFQGRRLGQYTISTSVQVHNIANSDIDHAEKTLVLLLEFLLVKYLNRQNAILGDSSRLLSACHTDNNRCPCVLQIEALVPVWIQGLLNHTRRPSLLAIDGGDRKGIGKAWSLLDRVSPNLPCWSTHERHPSCTTHQPR